MTIEGDLFDAARDALEAEDKSLQALFKASDTDVAHGLTYWLFETTLVYVIFKAWLPKVNVVWEHALEKEARRRPDANMVGRSGAHEKCDLVIREGERVVAAFEAKWWNYDTAKTRRLLQEDANKLREAFPTPEVGKYILTFWWGESETWTKDYNDAKQTRHADPGLRFVDAKQFATKLLGGKAGYFALGLLKVE